MKRETRRRDRAFGLTTTFRGALRRRFVPQSPSPGVGGEGESAATIVEVHREVMPGDDCPSEGLRVSEQERLLPDVPLIVEGLLLRARVLVDSGAPTDAAEAILGHVAALREGRD